jgi:hypothetical protein
MVNDNSQTHASQSTISLDHEPEVLDLVVNSIMGYGTW